MTGTKAVAHDVGGHPVAGGGRFRTGRVFRISGGVATPEELSRLERLGLQVLIDLRGDREDRTSVIEWCDVAGIRYERQPIVVGNPGGMMAELQVEGKTAEDGRRFLAAAYRRVVDEFGPQLVGTLTTIATGDVVGFGCAAGKDRTGLLSALLQSVLGVERCVVLSTYTSHAPDPERLRARFSAWGFTEEGEDFTPAMTYVLGAPEELLADTLDHLDATYGGVVPYLESVGLPPGTVERLRGVLVERYVRQFCCRRGVSTPSRRVRAACWVSQ